MPRYFIATLGCKLNQFDSAHAEGVLRGGDFSPTDDPAEADVILLNTCTVTKKADADGRRLARRLRRLNANARIIATGCYAEREPEALESLGVLDQVVGLKQREELPQFLLDGAECSTQTIDLFFGDRSRAFLRVQEGCDLKCSYCIIPSVRGTSRSTPAAKVCSDLASLAGREVREVGLTGINTGAWGADLEERLELADLLESILAEIDRGKLPLRIRLGSLEPRTISSRVLDLMATHPEQIVPHIQIPLQSGSDKVLARMSRNYRTTRYREIIEHCADRVPDICLGADVITGFPGESSSDHERTLEVIDSLPLAYLHVFTFSPRPGTRAIDFDQPVPEREAGIRTNALRALSERKGRAFRREQLGTTRLGLGLHAKADCGSVRVLTDNYIEILVPSAPQGEITRVSLDRLEDEGLVLRGTVTS